MARAWEGPVVEARDYGSDFEDDEEFAVELNESVSEY